MDSLRAQMQTMLDACAISNKKKDKKARKARPKTGAVNIGNGLPPLGLTTLAIIASDRGLRLCHHGGKADPNPGSGGKPTIMSLSTALALTEPERGKILKQQVQGNIHVWVSLHCLIHCLIHCHHSTS